MQVMRTKKIFVGGLSATTSLEDIKAYFEQFSKVLKEIHFYWCLHTFVHDLFPSITR